ncbi:hypothetical protein CC80DRAFT_446771 [Byssothecium circinans]|uniref:Sensitive to high expression protein 9, mitochondrial n=1 Tax=Byssothecium circinans TaxID=147558 RepID=A0A6A5TT89_9PLEO|nr:hypothetical protein CC80DRAFT_446771 [Byssothecium circinans]
MRPLLQHASRAFSAYAAPIARPSSARSFASRVPSQFSICARCQYRAFTAPRCGQTGLGVTEVLKRRFHQTPNDERKPLEEKEGPLGPKVPPDTTDPILVEPTATPKKDETVSDSSHKDPRNTSNTSSKKTEVVDNIARVPAEQLPSHREAQRWDFSKQLNKLMDDLLPKLADMSHKVNTYTGTDYSGIEALKQEIKEQEKLVKARRAAIEEAKVALDAAHQQQASSQKEVVALLERKHSWSAADLERYMSLIRSEHVNDQAVREAKEAIVAAESALEEARAQLEKRERAQYHEEQIWSDTIRRNSTWVTFGLMGVNIILLLASLLVFEPYRRRKIVREVKAALEAQKVAIDSVASPASQATASVAAPIGAIEAEINKVVEPAELATTSPEVLANAEPSVDASATPGKLEIAIEETPTTPEVTQEPITEASAPETIPHTPEGVDAQEAINIEEEVQADTTSQTWQDKVTFIAKDIISERVISMRRLDFTTAMLQSAAAGAIITAAIVGLLRPR